MWRFRFISVLLLITLLFLPISYSSAATNFFKNKTMTFIVPFGPGGGFDTWARMAAPYMKKYLDLRKFRVVNKPGGGALIGTNAIYHAKPDGLTIGNSTVAGDLLDQISGAPGVHFDMTKFSWIGRPDRPAESLIVRKNSKYQNFNEFYNLRGTSKKIQLLTPGRGTSAYDAAVLTFNAFGIPYKAISPFKGSHSASASFVSGLGDTMVLPLVDALKLGNNVKVVALLSTEHFKNVQAPNIVEISKKHHVNTKTERLVKLVANLTDLGHAWIGPPGIPQKRLQAIREAFKKTVHNPNFIKQAKKTGFMIKYASGQKLEKMVKWGISNKAQFEQIMPKNQ